MSEELYRWEPLSVEKTVELLAGLEAPWWIAGGWAIAQLWMFWLAPIIGALLAGIVYRYLGSGDQD